MNSVDGWWAGNDDGRPYGVCKRKVCTECSHRLPLDARVFHLLHYLFIVAFLSPFWWIYYQVAMPTTIKNTFDICL